MRARSNKCPSCGKQHVPGFAFCQRCGVPLEAELGNNPPIEHRSGEGDGEEATDLHGRILRLLERGKRKDAVRLYYDVVGGDIEVAEAAIEELAKNVEFAEVRSNVPEPTVREQAGWFSGCVAALRTLMGLDRA